MESALSSLILRSGEAGRVESGHPWVYPRAVSRVTGSVNDGDLVQVKDHRRRFLGVGLYHSRSKIRVRMLGKTRFKLNQSFFESRIREAAAYRKRWLSQAGSFRVVNAEADFLSGLIVDKYEDVLVLQTASLGMDRRKSLIVDVLQRMFAPRAIVERNDFTARDLEGLPRQSGLLSGQLDGPVSVKLNGIEFLVDPFQGQKTGLYLDQQENYSRVAEFGPRARVLDTFTCFGGFATHAAKAGAHSVHGIDQSSAAIEAARRNAEVNGVADHCSWEAANVFDWLRKRDKAHHDDPSGESDYDLIILDPPSFTRSRRAVPEALRGYKEINLRALKLLRPGGILATFCCSHHVDAPTFQQVILEAAVDAGKALTRVATYNQSLDHPVVLNIPETEYLKGFAFQARVA